MRRLGSYRAPSELEAKPSLNKLLEVLAAEALQTISLVDPPGNELDTENLTAHPTSQVVAVPKPNTISIKSSRLKLFPVNQHDLRDLIDMGLVEMRDDAPVLSNAGAGVIS